MQFTQYGYQCKCGPTTELIKVAYVFDSPVKFTPANSRRFSVVPYCLHPPPAPYDDVDIDHSNADLEAGRAFPFPIHLRTTHQVKIIVCCLVGQGLYMVINSIPFDSISSSMMAEEINKMNRSRYYTHPTSFHLLP